MSQTNNNDFFENIDNNQNLLLEESNDELEEQEEVEEEKSKKHKGVFSIKHKEDANGPIKNFHKENKKRIKDSKPKMIFAGITISIMIICLFVYSVAYLLSPTFSIEANISVTKGGYNLEYTICKLPRGRFDENVKIGKTYYIDQDGYIVETPREGIQMSVIDLNDETVLLEFDIQAIPDFVDTHTLKTVMQNEKTYGKYVSTVYLNGKVIAGRFILHRITLQQKTQ